MEWTDEALLSRHAAQRLKTLATQMGIRSRLVSRRKGRSYVVLLGPSEQQLSDFYTAKQRVNALSNVLYLVQREAHSAGVK